MGGEEASPVCPEVPREEEAIVSDRNHQTYQGDISSYQF